MKIQATVVADSVNEFGNRLTTLLVTMPRYILAEFNTHRMLSKNSASSRAIPFKKMVEAVEKNPFIPVAWMKDHKGMQGTEYFSFDLTLKHFEKQWLEARDKAVHHSTILQMGDGYKPLTKQLANRLLEPFMWHTVLVSATEWENFFHLRCPDYAFAVGKGEINFRSRADAMKNYSVNELYPDMDIDNTNYISWAKYNRGQADIHMMLTAEAIWDAMNESQPKLLKAGEWHIPFGDFFIDEKFTTLVHNSWKASDKIKEVDLVALELAIKVSVARCAQTSYTVVGEDDKPMDYDKLVALHDRLAKSGHWSPFEHCAKAMDRFEFSCNAKGDGRPCYEDGLSFEEKELGWSGNFRGFIQYRKLFANENITK